MELLQQIDYSKTKENDSSFLKRFYIYQKERFPVLGYASLIACFSFSTIFYSRMCRGVHGFVDWNAYLVSTFTAATLFLLIRILDEFKDAEDDAEYRPELPVPRGIISFRELLMLGIILLGFQIIINLVCFPKMMLLYFVIILYLIGMNNDFFIPKWLRKHPFFYATSHVFIVTLIAIYVSGFDWFLAGADIPKGLILFFAVSFMNGIVIEIGRKIRIKEKETTGVPTYSSMLGANKACILWIGALFVTLCFSVGAAYFAGYGKISLLILGTMFIICSHPAFLFLKHKTEYGSVAIERAAILWIFSMYLTLGGAPVLQKLFF